MYLQYLELGTHTFTMTTDKGSTDFKLELINAVSTSFDTSVKSYVYGSGTGIAIPADFSTATVTSLRIGTTRVDAQFYDYADGSFILKPALCESLYGTTNSPCCFPTMTPISFRSCPTACSTPILSWA